MRGPRAPLLPPCGPPLNPYPEQPLIPLPARMRLSYAPGQRPAQAGPPFPPTETPHKEPEPASQHKPTTQGTSDPPTIASSWVTLVRVVRGCGLCAWGCGGWLLWGVW